MTTIVRIIIVCAEVRELRRLKNLEKRGKTLTRNNGDYNECFFRTTEAATDALATLIPIPQSLTPTPPKSVWCLLQEFSGKSRSSTDGFSSKFEGTYWRPVFSVLVFSQFPPQSFGPGFRIYRYFSSQSVRKK